MAGVRATLGLDVGGTSTLALAVGEDGRVLARADGPGANVRSAAGSAEAALRGVLDTVASGLPAGTVVVALVAGMAGAGPAGRDRGAAVLEGALGASALPGPRRVDVVTDPVVAYAAGAPGPDGALLLAGTGAVACRMSGWREAARCDGLGWLLGDAGSGVWIGLAGLRAAAAALDGRGPATALTAAALALAVPAGEGTGDPRQDLVRLVDRSAPAGLGDFAPAVARAAAAGDELAARIVADAVGALTTSLRAVVDRPADVVLAGSVLTRSGPVRDGVRGSLTGAGHTLHDARAPVLGAVRLACEAAGWSPPPAAVRGPAAGG